MHHKSLVCINLAVVMLFATWSSAQTLEKKLTTKEIERISRDALFLLVVPTRTTIVIGTGFLISTDPPILVTCGHVTDLYEPPLGVAIIQNETGYRAVAVKDHYHPKYEGGKANMCPDVALLEVQLQPEIKVKPLRLAKPESLQNLLASEIVTRGFPLYSVDNKAERNLPDTVIQEGIISRLCDWRGAKERTSMENRPLLQLSITNFGGASGSPIMNRAGEVIGIIHGSELVPAPETGPDNLREVANGLQAQFVWELLEQKYPKVAERLRKEHQEPAIASKPQ